MDLTTKQRHAIYDALGFDPIDEDILRAIRLTRDTSTERLKAQLEQAEAVFEERGGRGVELAEEIDRIKIALAVRSAAPTHFILMGDVLHAGKIRVEASSLEEAIRKAEDGDFEVYDESGKNLAFDWNGDEDSVETE